MDRRITDKEINQIIENLDSECTLAVLLSLETAMRADEIITLNRDTDVDFEKKIARLQNPKCGKPYDIYLSDKAIELIKNANPTENGNLLSIDSEYLSSAFDRTAKSRGINDIRFLDICHEARYRLSKIMSAEKLAETIGHQYGPGHNCAHIDKYYK